MDKEEFNSLCKSLRKYIEPALYKIFGCLPPEKIVNDYISFLAKRGLN